MTKLVSSLLAAAVVALFLSPIGFFGDIGTQQSERDVADPAIPARMLSGIAFPEPIDTSVSIPEYPIVSRALMLNGGSSDVVVEDLNDDGLSDLVVSVYESLTISIFYRQVDGTFKTYPSLNISTLYRPVSIAAADLFSSGEHHIISLENRSLLDTHLVMYELTSEMTYEIWLDKSTWGNGADFVVGEFSGDSDLDLAVACESPDPLVDGGMLEVRFGPSYSTFVLVPAGRGPRTLVSADLDDDAEPEIAVGNYHDSSVMIFDGPFAFDSIPTSILAVMGRPTGLVAGLLNADLSVDLAVISESSDAVRFYFQSLGSFPASESMNISIPHPPSSICTEDMNGDGAQDLLVLSRRASVALGYNQGVSSPLWNADPSFVFPTSGEPRSAVISDIDGDGSTDVAVAACGPDWRGAALALYPARQLSYSNSNSTTWTRSGVEPSMLVTGDFDGDDVVDLILVNAEDNSVDFVPSFGATVTTIPIGFAPGGAISGDFNDDGFCDLLVPMRQGPTVACLLGLATFPDTRIALTASGVVTDIETGDFNHDSYIDFVVSTEEGVLDIFFSDGSAAPFGDPYAISTSDGVGIWAIAAGDFNSDGLDDIAYTRPIRKIVILLQDQTIPFGPSSPTLTLSHNEGPDFVALWSGDLNGDGLTDIAAMRPSDASVYLFDQTDFELAPYPFTALNLPEIPEFVSVVDATDDGSADLIAIFEGTDLLFLYRQDGGSFTSSPTMAFVTGSRPVYATIGDGTRDHRGDMLAISTGSDSVSAWEQFNFPPEVDSGGPYATREGDSLQFNASVSTGTSEMPFMEYRWDFGDGTPVTDWIRDSTPIHVYNLTGNHSVSVEVRDPVGLASSDSTYVVVLDSYPLVRFSWSPEVVDEGQTVVFLDETWSHDPIVLRSWYLDGEYAGDDVTLTTEFQNGSHEVALVVVDSDGSEVGVIRTLAVNRLAPVLRMVAPAEGTEGVPIPFTVIVDEWHGGPVDSIVKYEWDFFYLTEEFNPDPYVPNADSVSHVFSASQWWQLYRVAVRVTDSDGNQSLATVDIRIYDSGPTVGLELNTTDPREGVPFSFICTWSSFDGIVDWTWNLIYPDGHSEWFYLDAEDMACFGFDSLNDGDYTMRLTAREADGNTSVAQLDLYVSEIPPLVELVVGCQDLEGEYFEEFSSVEFSAVCGGLDDIALFEWDFNAPGGEFIPDEQSGAVGSANWTYVQIGNYSAKVRVTDTDGSTAIAFVYVEIRQKPLSGRLDVDILIHRGWDSREFTFDPSNLAEKFPDIVHVIWEFGDGIIESRDGLPVDTVFHVYASGRDYYLNVTIVDDDGYSYVITGMMFVTPPVVTLVSPDVESVVRSGTPIRFEIIPGTRQLNIVMFDVNNQGYNPFPVHYVIDTTNWTSVTHVITVMAWDWGGNIVFLRNINITIDDVFPISYVSLNERRIYGGEEFKLYVWVNDFNVRADGIVLNVKFPDDRQFLSYAVLEDPQEPGRFYAIFRAPPVKGEVQFFANVTDLAGNWDESAVFSIEMRMRFMTVAWPYLLVAMAVATVSVSAYFLREERTAIDEAFVIYKDGRMISHSTRRLRPSMDAQVLSSMFVAIQDFVRDSFKDVTSFTLRRLEFGERNVLVEKGDNIYLAVVLHGQANRKSMLKMRRTVSEIEGSLGRVLVDWDGDLDSVRSVNNHVKNLYSRAPLFPRQLRKDT